MDKFAFIKHLMGFLRLLGKKTPFLLPLTVLVLALLWVLLRKREKLRREREREMMERKNERGTK